MQEWKIIYTIRMRSGSVQEEMFTVEGDTIQDGLDEAFRDLVALECEHEEIAETVVLGIYAAGDALQEAS